MNNVAIGYYSVAVGYDAVNIPYKKIIILTSKVLIDPMAQKYCPKSNTISYIIYDSNTCFNAIFANDCWASDSYYSQLNDAVIQYNKMYPRWMTLFLSIKVYLGNISHDILSNITSYYINSYE
jgi:hypothetical protein